VAVGKFRAIIFDIGRVLIRVDVGRALSGLAQGLTLSANEIWSALQKDPRWLDWQEGRIPPREWHSHIAKKLGATITFEQFTEAWNRSLDPQPIHNSTFLGNLGRSYRLAVLSNTDPLHVAHMESTYDFFKFFPVRIYSCSLGTSKPNPLIYKQALKACKVPAETAIYIDDVPAYAEAAQRLGMAGIVFTSPEQLQAELRALGIDVN
jgi:HAD superfamily hydrolase (TIGR01509 family)